jgi:hypothetical protein
MEQILVSQTNIQSASQEIPHLLWIPKIHSQESAIGASSEPDKSNPKLPTLFP